jgi:hypothetical protein
VNIRVAKNTSPRDLSHSESSQRNDESIGRKFRAAVFGWPPILLPLSGPSEHTLGSAPARPGSNWPSGQISGDKFDLSDEFELIDTHFVSQEHWNNASLIQKGTRQVAEFGPEKF